MMKRLLICSVVAFVVVAAVSLALAKEKGPQASGHTKEGPGRHWLAKDANSCAMADANRPRHGRMFKRAFHKRVKRLESVKEIAAGEGATKTVAALDEMIADEKARFKNRITRMRKRRGEFGRKRERKGRHGHWRKGEHPHGGPEAKGEASGEHAHRHHKGHKPPEGHEP